MDLFFDWYRRLWKWAATRPNLAERFGGFLVFAIAALGFVFVILVMGAASVFSGCAG